MEQFGLREVAKSQGRFLSGGERRKLEIARAMVTDPSLILLDEPFSGVDPIAVEDLQREIRRLVASGVSILITDHNVERTLEVADKAYIIDHGKVIASGPPAEHHPRRARPKELSRQHLLRRRIRRTMRMEPKGFQTARPCYD